MFEISRIFGNWFIIHYHTGCPFIVETSPIDERPTLSECGRGDDKYIFLSLGQAAKTAQHFCFISDYLKFDIFHDLCPELGAKFLKTTVL